MGSTPINRQIWNMDRLMASRHRIRRRRRSGFAHDGGGTHRLFGRIVVERKESGLKEVAVSSLVVENVGRRLGHHRTEMLTSHVADFIHSDDRSHIRTGQIL